MSILQYLAKLDRVRKLIFSWLASRDSYTWRKSLIIVKIITLMVLSFSILFFYYELIEPVYCCGGSNQKTIDGTSITYNYDIKSEGGAIKTEKPITFTLYIFEIYLNMRGLDAEHPPDNITRRICVSSARNIDTGQYDPCVDINLNKTNEISSGEGSKYVNYQFIDLDGFEWKRKFIVPRKENIFFDEKNMESIDIIPRQQSDVSIIFPLIIILTTIFSMITDAFSKYFEIKQEELDHENS